MQEWPEAPNWLVDEQTACVDWLTVTTSAPDIKRDLFAACVDTMEQLKSQGNVVKTWGLRGYKGWACNSLRWGTRKDSDIVMMSGALAQTNYVELLRTCPNPTRIDLAVTVTLATPLEGVAYNAFSSSTDKDALDGRLTRKFTFLRNSQGGETLYVGSRFSDQYGRLYDKGREDRQSLEAGVPEGKIWRYEVEFKGVRAKRIGDQIIQKLRETDDIHQEIGDTVYKWFLARLPVVIMEPYENLPFHTEISANVSDAETTLNWLSTQVSPSIRRLRESGQLREVLDALGLSDIDNTNN